MDVSMAGILFHAPQHKSSYLQSKKWKCTKQSSSSLSTSLLSIPPIPKLSFSNLSLTPGITKQLPFLHSPFSSSDLQIYGHFPPYVSRVFPDLVPMDATLLDPVGHKHTVKVENLDGTFFFTKGWNHFRSFYDIEVGATVRCVYVRKETFEISIRDYKGVEWVYPPIPWAFEGAWLTPRVPGPHFAHDRLVANNNRFLCRLRKWISFAEFTGDAFTISKVWADQYLVSPGNEIYIVDELGNRWPCQLQEGVGDETDSVVVTTGWSFFCRRQGFRQGQSVAFGVTREKSHHLFFIENK